jgi:hypothetical protein
VLFAIASVRGGLLLLLEFASIFGGLLSFASVRSGILFVLPSVLMSSSDRLLRLGVPLLRTVWRKGVVP